MTTRPFPRTLLATSIMLREMLPAYYEVTVDYALEQVKVRRNAKGSRIATVAVLTASVTDQEGVHHAAVYLNNGNVRMALRAIANPETQFANFSDLHL